MERICGECIHYIHGQIENPCGKGNRFVGYLQENKHCWERAEGEADEDLVTKRCNKCGRELPLKMFFLTRRTPDGHTNVCKECKPRKK